MEYVFIVVLTGIFIFREVLHYRETKDLLDRLMSRNYLEYKDNQNPEDNDFGEKESDLVGIEQAKEDIVEEEE